MLDVLLREIVSRWEGIFAALARGHDVAPSQRLRTEGLMEAAVLLRTASADELTAKMAACYESVSGVSLEQHFGSHWMELFPFPQVPAMTKRAPVYPSTKD